MGKYAPHRRKLATNLTRAADMREHGKSFDEIAGALGISRGTAKNYVNVATRGDGRKHHGDEPRCKCGLLLPCTCQNGLHAVDFLGKRGESDYRMG